MPLIRIYEPCNHTFRIKNRNIQRNLIYNDRGA